MNSLLDNIASFSQRLAELPRRILSVLDVLTLRFEHRRLVQIAADEDAWYIHFAGQTTGPERIQDVLQRLAAGESPLAVLHASSIGDLDPEWQTLHHKNWCSDRATVAVWVVAFWTPVLLMAWMLVAHLASAIA